MKKNEKAKIVPFVPKSMEYPNYSEREFWRIRYDNIDGPFEWYDDYETLSPLIKQLNLQKRSIILHVGIGNSEFSEKMYDDGYKKQYNIDYSRNVIHYMKQRNKRLRSSMIFETMNVLDLDYEDNQFDVIFDKAVFDCVLCGIDADTKANIFMNEIYRVLKPKGYFFLVSNSNPESRLKYLQKSNLKYDIFIHIITNDKEQTKIYEENNTEMTFMKKTYYVYICQKMEEEDDEFEQDILKILEEKKKEKEIVNIDMKNMNKSENNEIENNNEEKEEKEEEEKEEKEEKTEEKDNTNEIQEGEDNKTQKSRSKTTKSNKSKKSKKKSNKTKNKSDN